MSDCILPGTQINLPVVYSLHAGISVASKFVDLYAEGNDFCEWAVAIPNVHFQIFCNNVSNNGPSQREAQTQTDPDQSRDRPALFQGHDEDAAAQAPEVHTEI